MLAIFGPCRVVRERFNSRPVQAAAGTSVVATPSYTWWIKVDLNWLLAGSSPQNFVMFAQTVSFFFPFSGKTWAYFRAILCCRNCASPSGEMFALSNALRVRFAWSYARLSSVRFASLNPLKFLCVVRLFYILDVLSLCCACVLCVRAHTLLLGVLDVVSQEPVCVLHRVTVVLCGAIVRCAKSMYFAMLANVCFGLRFVHFVLHPALSVLYISSVVADIPFHACVPFLSVVAGSFG